MALVHIPRACRRACWRHGGIPTHINTALTAALARCPLKDAGGALGRYQRHIVGRYKRRCEGAQARSSQVRSSVSSSSSSAAQQHAPCLSSLRPPVVLHNVNLTCALPPMHTSCTRRAHGMHTACTHKSHRKHHVMSTSQRDPEAVTFGAT